MKRKKGFTLMELIAVMGMSVIIGTVIMSLIISQNKMFFHINNETISQDQVRLIYSTIEDGIKSSSNRTDSSSIDVNNINIDGKSYTLPVVNSISKGKVLFAFTKNEKIYDASGNPMIDPATGQPIKIDRAYAYVYYKRSTDTVGQLAYLKGNDAKDTLNVLSVLSKDVKNATITKSGSEYIVDLVIKKDKAEENFKNVVTPRN